MPYVIPTVAEYANMSHNMRAHLMRKINAQFKAPEPTNEQLFTETLRVANVWLHMYGQDPEAGQHWLTLERIVAREQPVKK